jgi:hypothetical protein
MVQNSRLHLLAGGLILTLSLDAFAAAQTIHLERDFKGSASLSAPVGETYPPTRALSLSPASTSSLGYELTLPLSSFAEPERGNLQRDFKLNSVGVVNTGTAKPFRASATLWGRYGEFVLIKTAKHVSDVGIQFFKMGGLAGTEVVYFDIAKNRGIKLFDDAVTDLTIYGFPTDEFSESQLSSLDSVTPSFLPLGLQILQTPSSELLVVGRASQPAAVGDARTFANLKLYSDDATTLWQSAATEANDPANLDSRTVGAQGDVLAVARTSLISPFSARIPDPDGIVPETGGATTNPQQPYLLSTLITQVYVFDYRSVGRMSGGSVMLHQKSRATRDIASHITKGLPQDISVFSHVHPYGTWQAEKDANGKATGKYKLLTPAPYAYASDYTTFAHRLAIFITENRRQIPKEQKRSLTELLARGLQP